MNNGEFVSSHIKATENTTVAKLSILDQIKLLISKASNEDMAELDASEKMSAVQLRQKAALINLFERAASEIKAGDHTSATMQVSSKFIPYIDEVIDSKRGMGRYWDFQVHKKDLPLNIDHYIIVVMSKKVDETGGNKNAKK